LFIFDVPVAKIEAANRRRSNAPALETRDRPPGWIPTCQVAAKNKMGSHQESGQSTSLTLNCTLFRDASAFALATEAKAERQEERYL